MIIGLLKQAPYGSMLKMKMHSPSDGSTRNRMLAPTA